MGESSEEVRFTYLDLFKLMYKFTPNKSIFVWAIIFLVLSHSLSLLISLYIGKIIDFFVAFDGGSLRQFYIFLAILGGVFMVSALMRVLGKYWMHTSGVDAQYTIKTEGYERLLDFSVQWHEKELTGSKIQRLNSGARTIRDLFTLLSQKLISIATSVVGVITIFIFLDWIYFLLFMVYTIVFFSIEFHYDKKVSKIVKDLNKKLEKASGKFLEASSNVLSIKATGAKGSLVKHVKDVEQESRERRYTLRNTRTRKRALFQVVHAVALVVFFLLIGRSLIAGLISAGFILVYYDYFARMRNAIAESAELSNTLVESKENVRRMLPIFNLNPEKWFGKKKMPKGWKQISFDKVNFTYESEKKHFRIKDIDLTIKHNEKIGVVGRSGSGKSTIAKLFMGLYKIDHGQINIGQTPFYDISHDELTKHVAIVLQESELFNMSFKENITLLKKFDKKRFDMALDIAQLKPVLKKLPKGVETLLGEKGYKLSGGERQRIGIARAIYKNPQILILDEATSALDTHTERKIQHQLEKKLKNKTIISIAHRLSTLTGVDRIIVFRQGKIIEEGTYKKLATSKSVFKSMLSQQK